MFVVNRQIKIGINSDGHSAGYAWASVGTNDQVLAVERDSRKGILVLIYVAHAT